MSDKEATVGGDVELAAALAALGHPKRLAILDMLMEGVQCNCEIHARLGLSFSLISHHMRILEAVGLVEGQRDPLDARWINYSVSLAALRMLKTRLDALLDAGRVRPRLADCGPRRACVSVESANTATYG